MQILALETSTELGSCALWHDGQVLERRCPDGRPHSETLLPLVRDLLAEAGTTFSALDGIAFGAGPGAFTGLRVACGIAQGLAVAGGQAVYPVAGLAAMAASAGAGQVLALLDARMGEVYAGAYWRQGDDYRLLDDIRVASPLALALPEGGQWVACGNAPAAYPALAARLAGQGIAVLPAILPLAGSIARLAAAAARRGEGIDAAQAAPLYVRDKVAKTVAERLSEGGRA